MFIYFVFLCVNMQNSRIYYSIEIQILNLIKFAFYIQRENLLQTNSKYTNYIYLNLNLIYYCEILTQKLLFLYK